MKREDLMKEIEHALARTCNEGLMCYVTVRMGLGRNRSAVMLISACASSSCCWGNAAKVEGEVLYCRQICAVTQGYGAGKSGWGPGRIRDHLDRVLHGYAGPDA